MVKILVDKDGATRGGASVVGTGKWMVISARRCGYGEEVRVQLERVVMVVVVMVVVMVVIVVVVSPSLLA